MTTARKTMFFAFYSFKGGVGRSMALLNCASCLAGYDRSVLMIDLDLESPGLSFLCTTPLKNKGSGMADLIHIFMKDPTYFSANATAIVRDSVVPFGMLDHGSVRAFNNVSLLPAGNLKDEYVASISQIRWLDPSLESRVDDFATALRNSIVELDLFDYVLIDCRTGWSESGYVGCRLLADHIVTFCALNEQNAQGTAHFLSRVASWSRVCEKTQRVVLVASPVPEWEEEVKKKRIGEVLSTLSKGGNATPEFTLQLPYHPNLALREESVVCSWPDSNLALRYVRLAQVVLEICEDSAEQLERSIVSQIDAVMRSNEVDSSLDPILTERTLRRLGSTDSERSKGIGKFARLALMRQGKLLFDRQNFQCQQFFESAVHISCILQDRESESESLFSLGEASRRFGRYLAAAAHYQAALEATTKAQLQELCRYAIADLNRVCYRLAEAEKEFVELLTSSDNDAQKRFHAAAAIALGDICRLQFRFEESKTYFDIGKQSAAACNDDRLVQLSGLFVSFLQARIDTTKDEKFRVIVTSLRDFPDPSIAIRATLLLSELEGLRSNWQAAIDAATWAYERATNLSLEGYSAEASATISSIYFKMDNTEVANRWLSIAETFFSRERVSHPMLNKTTTLH